MTKTGATIRPAKDSDKKTWNDTVNHPLQSWSWGRFRQRMGVDVVRLVTENNKKILGCWQLTFHPVPHTGWTIGYFPKGPAPDAGMIASLKDVGRQKNAIFIQLEPDVGKISDSPVTLQPELRSSHHPLFTKHTFVLDLDKSEEELLAAMHSKTRYNIRIAQKHGVVIRQDSSPEAFEAYLALNRETTGRQGFFAHNPAYHQTMWDTMHTEGNAQLFTATYNGEILASWIVFVWKDTVYYPYGTSSRKFREVMAPTLLLWEIVRWAKAQGFRYFDLWGALPPGADTNDPWYGFHRFKQGFGPLHVEFIGSFDLVLRPLLYRLYILADMVRWALLRRKRR